MNKYKIELERLLKKHGLLVGLLNVIDTDISIRRELEQINDIPFPLRKSVEVERTREQLQHHLAEVKEDILGMIDIIRKHEGIG
ncbi:MAG: hypothetical protein H6658_02035 [Ardenticatenaceae bacterium]|nr:hypothetical protein [Ardenticatenaceae bacterium]